MSALRFVNKVALVTGGANGIGKATALAFARQGARVVVSDMNTVDGQSSVREINELTQSKNAIFLPCDVSSYSQVQKLIDGTLRAFGRLDCAFNNAGIEGAQGSLADQSNEAFDRVIDVNLRGVWNCMKLEIGVMLKQSGGGSIVNCSSIAGLVGFTGIAPYVASKHAVLGLTRAAALDYAKSGIRINSVHPGVIRTAMIDRFTGGSREAEIMFENATPMGRMGKPEEIANTVLFLASDEASFLTGQPITVDGGWTAQ
ncbi:mitochondrial 3-oxoacyl-[acyl-carrier protein] reductase [Andalucia godoyi]|uniref:Mitochondrial 3-oxoacyl-[acyl-carrier protein] reductase n=1 Tax=Andalucia godoyi TaxID=505711 RepID=A0A8K0AGW6_ANDGO|nr:mitochondrial 3-oxoacyl-[acyl-carrier protein] reductase [Andalucia godoyi]|eukprot:ANDGO_05706.mRNA.1 mitochondrial 3-oxoacyl-[acyl-carrier protein] reductase